MAEWRDWHGSWHGSGNPTTLAEWRDWHGSTTLAEWRDWHGSCWHGSRFRFWAVRLAAVETVASMPARESIDVLRSATRDQSSRVRRAAIRVLGATGDATLVGFFRDAFNADSSYQVQAEALRAIGRSGDRNHLEFLKEAAELDSPRDVIRTAAEWAIEEISQRS